MIKFTIDLESYAEPKTVQEEKITELSKAFLTSFNKLAEDYNRFAGQLKGDLCKTGLAHRSSAVAERQWLDSLNVTRIEDISKKI